MNDFAWALALFVLLDPLELVRRTKPIRPLLIRMLACFEPALSVSRNMMPSNEPLGPAPGVSARTMICPLPVHGR